jgi:uncharacterized protein (UPF0216 family)
MPHAIQSLEEKLTYNELEIHLADGHFLYKKGRELSENTR